MNKSYKPWRCALVTLLAGAVVLQARAQTTHATVGPVDFDYQLVSGGIILTNVTSTNPTAWTAQFAYQHNSPPGTYFGDGGGGSTVSAGQVSVTGKSYATWAVGDEISFAWYTNENGAVTTYKYSGPFSWIPDSPKVKVVIHNRDDRDWKYIYLSSPNTVVAGGDATEEFTQSTLTATGDLYFYFYTKVHYLDRHPDQANAPFWYKPDGTAIASTDPSAITSTDTEFGFTVGPVRASDCKIPERVFTFTIDAGTGRDRITPPASHVVVSGGTGPGGTGTGPGNPTVSSGGPSSNTTAGATGAGGNTGSADTFAGLNIHSHDSTGAQRDPVILNPLPNPTHFSGTTDDGKAIVEALQGQDKKADLRWETSELAADDRARAIIKGITGQDGGNSGKVDGTGKQQATDDLAGAANGAQTAFQTLVPDFSGDGLSVPSEDDGLTLFSFSVDSAHTFSLKPFEYMPSLPTWLGYIREVQLLFIGVAFCVFGQRKFEEYFQLWWNTPQHQALPEVGMVTIPGEGWGKQLALALTLCSIFVGCVAASIAAINTNLGQLVSGATLGTVVSHAAAGINGMASNFTKAYSIIGLGCPIAAYLEAIGLYFTISWSIPALWIAALATAKTLAF